MTSKLFKFTILLCIGLATACTDSSPETKTDTFVTNAEYALRALDNESATVVAFQVKPIRQTACEYMHIELGGLNTAGQWVVTRALTPGKDERNNFGQYNLENQIHFSDVDGVGQFGVLGLGCKPSNEDIKITRGLMATFEVEQGKLNYIGELALTPVGTGFVKYDVTDRSDYALKQIQEQLPALEIYFKSNIMKTPKVDLGLSAEDLTKLDKISRIKR